MWLLTYPKGDDPCPPPCPRPFVAILPVHAAAFSETFLTATRAPCSDHFWRSTVMKVLKIAMLAATLLPLASYAVLGGAPSSSSSSPVMLRATPQSADAASTGT